MSEEAARCDLDAAAVKKIFLSIKLLRRRVHLNRERRPLDRLVAQDDRQRVLATVGPPLCWDHLFIEVDEQRAAGRP